MDSLKNFYYPLRRTSVKVIDVQNNPMYRQVFSLGKKLAESHEILTDQAHQTQMLFVVSSTTPFLDESLEPAPRF